MDKIDKKWFESLSKKDQEIFLGLLSALLSNPNIMPNWHPDSIVRKAKELLESFSRGAK